MAVTTREGIAPGARRFRPYPAYKDSGVAWLGKIPTHWKMDRLKWTVNDCQNGIWGDEPDGTNDIACVRVSDFDRMKFRVKLEEPTYRAVEPRVARARGLKPGDLLLEKSGGGEKQLVGAVALFDHTIPAVCSNFIARMPPAPGFSPSFLCYVHAAAYSARLNLCSIKQNIGIQNLDSDMYLHERLALPPVHEQEAIARFLDKETAKIDTLVAKRERLIELLQEKRTTLITQAATKGLDPNFPRKDSGIEWLGKIPAHWDVEKTKYAARLESGHTPSRQHPEYWENCTIPWFGLADVWQIRSGLKEYVSETNEKISEVGLAHSAARLLPKRTVILSRTASVGFSAIMETSMATTQDYVNWICGPSLVPEFLLYVFRAMAKEFEKLMMGSTHQTIYMPDVGRFVCPIPPIEEQRKIVAYIREQLQKINELEAKVQAAINYFKEYRTALISAAVTGKIDVRNLA